MRRTASSYPMLIALPTSSATRRSDATGGSVLISVRDLMSRMFVMATERSLLEILTLPDSSKVRRSRCFHTNISSRSIAPRPAATRDERLRMQPPHRPQECETASGLFLLGFLEHERVFRQASVLPDLADSRSSSAFVFHRWGCSNTGASPSQTMRSRRCSETVNNGWVERYGHSSPIGTREGPRAPWPFSMTSTRGTPASFAASAAVE